MSKRKLLERIEKRYRNRVKEARLQALIATQQELAQLTGINRTTINALENNRLFLSSQYALAISEVLRCNLNALYQKRYDENGKRTGMLE